MKLFELKSRRSFYATSNDDGFRRGIDASGWTLLAPDTAHGTLDLDNAFVVGVEVWSYPDLTFLESLRDILEANKVYVFSIDDFLDEPKFAEVVPGGKIPMASPVIVRYKKSKMFWQKEGRAAFGLLSQRKELG